VRELNLLAAASQPPLTVLRPPAFQDGVGQTGESPDDPVLRLLAGGPRHVDEIAREVGLPVARVSSSLQLLELTGAVRQTGPMTYSLA